MADNLTTQSATPATIPASTVIATDDAGAAGHVQVVKLAVSTDGSATPLTANNTDGLLVNLGANNDVTVTGTVTANLAAGTNNIGDVDILSIAAGDNNIGNVDVVSSALPTGASTLAEQQSQTTHLATIAGDTTDIEAAVELIDDAIATIAAATPAKGMAAAGTDGTNARILKTDASGELQVDVLTMPTVAVTQSGTWDEVGINDSGNSITVDGTVTANLAAGTNNIGDVDILSIAAGDNNIGNVDIVTMPNVTNAGTFPVQVDGNALTALQLIDDTVAVLGTATYTEATTKGNVIGAVRRDADTTLADTTNEIAPLQVDARGALKVEAFSGETLPVSLASVPSHAVTNAGTFAVQVDGAALTALQLIDDTVFADDAAFTPAVSKVSMAGFEADESSTDSVDEGDAGAARMTLDRKLITNPQPHTAGGLDVGNFDTGDTFTALTNTAQVVKGSAGQVYGYYIYNPNATATYVILYNVAAASVTVGTTTPRMVICIPATAAANLSGTHGIVFDTAIAIAAATTGGGNSAPGTALEAMIFYK